MRALALLLLLAALVGSGCAGAEGKRAQELLQEAQAAQSAVSSATFSAELSMEAQGQEMRVSLDGGGYFKGDRAGDMYVTVDLSGIPGAPGTAGFVVKGDRAYVSDGSGWQSMPVPEGQADPAQQLDPALVAKAMAALTESVEDVSVTEGQVFQGEPVTIVAGRIDTAKLLLSLASEMRVAEGFPGAELFPVEELAKHLGDVRASLMVSDRTGLLQGAVVSMRITGDDASETFDLRVVYRLESVDEPVALPAVP